ncbi:hypothetical protein SPRG_16885 [Saprolegnia parasitica CBS 223.65]|uniref:valine--tRNA ligase n=1 Tax=Saprolegnia parasitica (strain CBS 223.65) TaxID=695850 RepID=A0A067BH88_SAPPC|nr:hypothetical protein SPRG_16885 [Saprolegnia parasitica CBS 223.65]KDO17719.1 hypothetical protein SPRG_16885 [Saprolegnia parasitica CBS 223.65]|eukprot:XP_012211570.1 hypothetical protein SPRG_16885 [Saprolegnia parasitica CBS 223.65]
MDLQRVVASRHFCNKMWNALRYALPLVQTSSSSSLESHAPSMSLADRWILSRLADAVTKVHDGYGTFKLATSANAAQRFFIQELCDVYIEFSKPVLYHEDAHAKEAAKATLTTALDTSLRLLHPIMPFVTEELWQRLQGGSEHSLMTAAFPDPAQWARWVDRDAEASMQAVLDVMHAVRSLRHTRKTLAPDASTVE